MKKLLGAVAIMLLLAGCGVSGATPQASPTPTPTDTPTPAPTFPALGEWVYTAPQSLFQDQFALVLAIQQANSTSNVASLTSLIGVCRWDSTMQANTPQADTFASSASDTITGSDITLSANVTYPNVYNNTLHESTVYSMQFAGTLDSGGAILLASSGLNGVQDYTFTPTSNGVAQEQRQFQQGTCTS